MFEYLNRKQSLKKPEIISNPCRAYRNDKRLWQGIPGIEVISPDTIYACWYSGGKGEGKENYVVLSRSQNNTETWCNPLFIVAPSRSVRAFDPCLWKDPLGRLWLFWSQSYHFYDGKAGVWYIRTDNPADEHPVWTEPVRICNGIMINKPIVSAFSGEWLLPVAIWNFTGCIKREDMSNEQYSSVFTSSDHGKSWDRKGGADVPARHFDEHMLIEKSENCLWMLVRTFYGIGESISTDGGCTWSRGRATRIEGPDSRFFIRKLLSGNLLLVNHFQFHNRSHLTAKLSYDCGNSWSDGLLLDERNNVSYPDGCQSSDGSIYIIYDRERTTDGEILLARFTEEDILQKKCVSSFSKLKITIDRLVKK